MHPTFFLTFLVGLFVVLSVTDRPAPTGPALQPVQLDAAQATDESELPRLVVVVDPKDAQR